MDRRTFLRNLALGGATVVALSMSLPVLADPPVTITLERTTDGRFRVPTNIAAQMSAGRQELLARQANNALRTAQKYNLSVPKANGLLTRFIRPVLAARGRGGILGNLLQIGLIAGLSWALSSGTITTSSSQIEQTRSGCGSPAGYMVAPSAITSTSTGIYSNSARNAVVAYQRSQIQWSGGTVPAPPGWNWSYQRNLPNGLVEVWFTKNVDGLNCSNLRFPAVQPLDIANTLDPADRVPVQHVQDVLRAAARDGLQTESTIPSAALSTDSTATVQQPGSMIEIPASGVDGGPITMGDLTAEWPAITTPDAQFQFPSDGYTQPNPTGPELPTDPSEPVGPTLPPVGEPVDPQPVGELPGFDAFSNPFKNLFDPFKNAFAVGDIACPAFNLPSVSFGSAGSMAGQTINVHCQIVEPLKPVLIAISGAMGGWVGIKHILDA